MGLLYFTKCVAKAVKFAQILKKILLKETYTFFNQLLKITFMLVSV